MARFQSIKGHLDLLDAFELLLQHSSYPKPKLLIIGDTFNPPSREEIEYKEAVLARIATGPLLDHITLFGYRDDVPLFLRAADVFVSPSRFETFGMAVVEAMALGTPVIATAAGGPAEIIQNGRNGILVPPGDPQALFHALQDLLNNPSTAQNLSAAARGTAGQYSVTARASRLREEYETLLQSRIQKR